MGQAGVLGNAASPWQGDPFHSTSKPWRNLKPDLGTPVSTAHLLKPESFYSSCKDTKLHRGWGGGEQTVVQHLLCRNRPCGIQGSITQGRRAWAKVNGGVWPGKSQREWGAEVTQTAWAPGAHVATLYCEDRVLGKHPTACPVHTRYRPPWRRDPVWVVWRVVCNCEHHTEKRAFPKERLKSNSFMVLLLKTKCIK